MAYYGRDDDGFIGFLIALGAFAFIGMMWLIVASADDGDKVSTETKISTCIKDLGENLNLHRDIDQRAFASCIANYYDNHDE